MITVLNDVGGALVPAAIRLSLQVFLLALFVLLIERIGGRRLPTSFRCGLWGLVVVKLWLPPSFQLPTGVGYWVGPWLERPAAQVSETTRHEVPRSLVEPDAVGETGIMSPTAESIAFPQPQMNREAWLVMVWGAGSLLFAGMLFFRNREVRRWKPSAQSPPEDLESRFRQLCESLGLRRPILRLTEGRHSPAVVGLWRPTVLFPSGLVRTLSPQSVDDILRHELVHLRRGDLWFHLLQNLTQGIWWWNPVVWLANLRIRALREVAVDEEVLVRGGGDAEGYSRTLLDVARFCSGGSGQVLGGVGAFGTRSDLRTRIERLLHGGLPRHAGLGRSGWAGLIGTALLTVPMAFGNRTEPEPVARPDENVLRGRNATSGAGFGKVSSSSREPSVSNESLEFARRYGTAPSASAESEASAATKPSTGGVITGSQELSSRIQGYVIAELKVPDVGDIYALKGRPVPGDRLAEVLAAELPVTDTNILVQLVIEASGSVPWPKVVRALNAANEARIPQLSVQMGSKSFASPNRALSILADRLVYLDSQVRDQLKKVGDLAHSLNVPNEAAEGSLFTAVPSGESREFIQRRAELGIRLARNQAVLQKLKAMADSERRYAINESQSSPLLRTLLADLTIVEQQKASLSPDFGPNHPEVERVQTVLGKVNAQIDDVVEGFLNQIQSEIDADKAELAELDTRAESAQREQAASLIRYRPYVQEKRKLDTLRRMRESLVLQIQQEAINTHAAEDQSSGKPASRE